MNRSSSSCLPSLSSLHTFIGLAVILCLYFTLQTSISIHDKSLPSNHIKTVLPFSYETQSIDQPSSYSFENQNMPQEATLHYDPKMEIETQSLGGLAQDFDITWGDHRGKFHENGELLTLSLDNYSGSGFQSKNEYLFAKIDINIKLVADNSAGTVTTFYMSSNETNHHDEIDFEFLGNQSGKPYTIHTNIFSQGKGNREQQFYLWFDPREDFHTYSILWNPSRIIFFVDGIPIREFNNMEAFGIPFPNKQPMRVFSSLWNADDWATQGGRVHTDWSKAPFVASYRNFRASACVWSYGSSFCGPDSSFENAWLVEELDEKGLEKLRWVQDNYMTYNYCDDKKRFYKLGLPKECTIYEFKSRRYY